MVHLICLETPVSTLRDRRRRSVIDFEKKTITVIQYELLKINSFMTLDVVLCFAIARAVDCEKIARRVRIGDARRFEFRATRNDNDDDDDDDDYHSWTFVRAYDANSNNSSCNYGLVGQRFFVLSRFAKVDCVSLELHCLVLVSSNKYICIYIYFFFKGFAFF